MEDSLRSRLSAGGGKKRGLAGGQPPSKLNDQRSCSLCTTTLARLAVFVNRGAVLRGEVIVYVEVPSFDLSPRQLAHIGEVGAALFAGRELQASGNGLISIRPTIGATREEGTNDDKREETARGSATRPRERRQGTRGRRTTDSHAPEFRRELYRAQVAQVNEHYPGVRTWIKDDATWLSVPSFPVGSDGPRANLLVAIPKRSSARITAWGFWDMDGRMSWIGYRHTNFPDGSICAFPADADYWREGDALPSYVDLLSEWSFRQLYYVVHRVWPGPQEGRWRYYRLKGTQPGECCPRCQSLKRYEDCCRPLDEAEACDSDRREFILEVGCDLGEQRPHRRVVEFAQGQRNRPPRMAIVHPAVRSKNWNPED